MAQTCVVIVDDDPLDRKFIIDSFRRTSANIQLIEVGDPRDALSSMATYVPDLALLDIDMPHMTGFDVLRAFRADIDAVDPAPSPPIVMLSNSKVESEIKKSLELGAAEYRVKPSTIDEYRRLAADLHQTYLPQKAA
ncbi:MAG: response regulator [Pseudomonadota bacterium]